MVGGENDEDEDTQCRKLPQYRSEKYQSAHVSRKEPPRRKGLSLTLGIVHGDQQICRTMGYTQNQYAGNKQRQLKVWAEGIYKLLQEQHAHARCQEVITDHDRWVGIYGCIPGSMAQGKTGKIMA